MGCLWHSGAKVSSDQNRLLVAVCWLPVSGCRLLVVGNVIDRFPDNTGPCHLMPHGLGVLSASGIFNGLCRGVRYAIMLMSWVLLFLVSVRGLFFTIQLRFRRIRGFVLQSG